MDLTKIIIIGLAITVFLISYWLITRNKEEDLGQPIVEEAQDE